MPGRGGAIYLFTKLLPRTDNVSDRAPEAGGKTLNQTWSQFCPGACDGISFLRIVLGRDWKIRKCCQEDRKGEKTKKENRSPPPLGTIARTKPSANQYPTSSHVLLSVLSSEFNKGAFFKAMTKYSM